MVSEKKEVNIRVIKGKEITDLQVVEGENLYKVLVQNNLLEPGACGGNRTCGKCWVRIDETVNIPLGISEKELLEKKDAGKNIRLACFINVMQEISVYLEATDIRGAKIIVEGRSITREIKPRINKVKAKFPVPTLEDQRADSCRLNDALPCQEWDISYTLLQELPYVMREGKQELTCLLKGKEIIAAYSEEHKNIYGIALDIGTTTVVGYLLDLETGEQLDIFSNLNPQRSYGADVISRIGYTKEHEQGLAELHKLIKEEINNIIQVFCAKNNINHYDIYEITVAGNTTMLHLLLNVPCHNIANAPYIPTFTSEVKIKAKQLGIKTHLEGYLIILPSVSGYIGSDTIAAVLASGMDKDEKINLLLDIGTNGEIVLGSKDNMYCCSAAAGPAFEGANITFGIGGVEGAIDHVDLKNTPLYTTIGQKDPIGICGSGIVDIIAELIRAGIVDKSGRMLKKEELQGKVAPELVERIIEYRGKMAFLIDKKSGVLITQKDIRELQLAKGAVSAGVSILMKTLGVSYDKIANVYLAGGFGNYLDVENAVTLKLMPPELQERVVPIGNGAGIGAKLTLLSDNMLKAATKVKENIKYLELSGSTEFQMEFVKGMNF